MTGVTGADMGVLAEPHICNRSPAGGAAGGCRARKREQEEGKREEGKPRVEGRGSRER